MQGLSCPQFGVEVCVPDFRFRWSGQATLSLCVNPPVEELRLQFSDALRRRGSAEAPLPSKETKSSEKSSEQGGFSGSSLLTT